MKGAWNHEAVIIFLLYIYKIQTTLCANCESIPHTACQRALYTSYVTTVHNKSHVTTVHNKCTMSRTVHHWQKSTPPQERKKEKQKITWNTLSHEWLTCSDTFTSRSRDYLIENKTCRFGYLPENKSSACSTTLNSVTRTGSIVCIYTVSYTHLTLPTKTLV